MEEIKNHFISDIKNWDKDENVDSNYFNASQNIILQPVADKNAKNHFEDTITNGIYLNHIKKYLTDKEYHDLKNIYWEWKIEVWGVTPWTNNVNYWKYLKSKRWDLVLFYAHKLIIYIWSVSYKLVNKELALKLWGENKTWQTWEYMYFLKYWKKEKIPIELFNLEIWYSQNFVVQWFSIVDIEKTKLLITKYWSLENLFFDLWANYSQPEDEQFQNVNNISSKIKNNDDIDKIISEIEKWISNKDMVEKQKTIIAIVRNTTLAKLVKERSNYICQICGKKPFETRNWFYAEVHHLKELAYWGADISSNMLCLCADCHRKFHYWNEWVTEELFKKLNHNIK